MPSSTTVLATLSVYLLVIPSVFSSPRAGTIPHLLARQSTDTVPAACRSACSAAVKALDTCNDNLKCLCTDKNAKDYAVCLNCAATETETFTNEDATSAMDEFIRECAGAGYTVGTGNGGGGGSGSSGGGGSGGSNPLVKNVATRSDFKYGVVLGAFVGGLILLV